MQDQHQVKVGFGDKVSHCHYSFTKREVNMNIFAALFLKHEHQVKVGHEMDHDHGPIAKEP